MTSPSPQIEFVGILSYIVNRLPKFEEDVEGHEAINKLFQQIHTFSTFANFILAHGYPEYDSAVEMFTLAFGPPSSSTMDDKGNPTSVWQTSNESCMTASSGFGWMFKLNNAIEFEHEEILAMFHHFIAGLIEAAPDKESLDAHIDMFNTLLEAV